MKQTAVEWLVSQLNKEGFAKVVTDEEIEQAKAMEKEQIVNAWIEATPRNIPKYEAITKDFAERYYNETFKSE